MHRHLANDHKIFDAKYHCIIGPTFEKRLSEVLWYARRKQRETIRKGGG
jgi:hypothetical protein